jgi:DNA-binding CsgD family transcriptional regulator
VTTASTSQLAHAATAAGCTALELWTLQQGTSHTISEIATQRGVTERAIYKTRRRAMLRIRAHYDVPERNTNAEVVKLRDAGHAWSHIAQILQIDRSVAIRHYQRATRFKRHA